MFYPFSSSFYLFIFFNFGYRKNSRIILYLAIFFLLTATLLPPSSPLVATQATLASASMPSCSTVADGVDPSPLEVMQRHAHKQFERLGEKIQITCMFEYLQVLSWGKRTL